MFAFNFGSPKRDCLIVNIWSDFLLHKQTEKKNTYRIECRNEQIKKWKCWITCFLASSLMLSSFPLCVVTSLTNGLNLNNKFCIRNDKRKKKRSACKFFGFFFRITMLIHSIFESNWLFRWDWTWCLFSKKFAFVVQTRKKKKPQIFVTKDKSSISLFRPWYNHK